MKTIINFATSGGEFNLTKSGTNIEGMITVKYKIQYASWDGRVILIGIHKLGSALKNQASLR